MAIKIKHTTALDQLKRMLSRSIRENGLDLTRSFVNALLPTQVVVSDLGEKHRQFQLKNHESLANYLIRRLCLIYQIDEPVFWDSNEQEAREARQVSIYAFWCITKGSYQYVGRHFRCSKRMVGYHIKKLLENKSLPKLYRRQMKALEDISKEFGV